MAARAETITTTETEAPAKPRRDRVLPPLRVTQEELATIKARAREAGLSVSEFQRRACLSGKVVVEEDRRVNVEAVRQLLAIGNNLNQLTKSGYIHQAIDRDSLRYVLGQVGSIVDELIS